MALGEDNMDNNVLKVSIDSLREAGADIDKHNRVIIDDLDYILIKMRELDEYFDSKAGREYKALMNNYVNRTKEYVSTRNEYLKNKLNEINTIYWELHGEIKESVTNKSKEAIDE